jgi:hypothetical protein
MYWGIGKDETTALRNARFRKRTTKVAQISHLSDDPGELSFNPWGDVSWSNPDCKVLTTYIVEDGKRRLLDDSMA